MINSLKIVVILKFWNNGFSYVSANEIRRVLNKNNATSRGRNNIMGLLFLFLFLFLSFFYNIEIIRSARDFVHNVFKISNNLLAGSMRCQALSLVLVIVVHIMPRNMSIEILLICIKCFG